MRYPPRKARNNTTKPNGTSRSFAESYPDCDENSSRRDAERSFTDHHGRAVGCLQAKLLDKGYLDCDESSSRRGVEHSSTDPYDSRSGFSSIVRAARSAVLEHYDRAVVDIKLLFRTAIRKLA